MSLLCRLLNFFVSGDGIVLDIYTLPQSAAFRHAAEEVARQVSIEAMKPELVIMTRAQ